jgi:hypothetical protein
MMKLKNNAGILLLAFVVGSIFFLIGKETGLRRNPAETSQKEVSAIEQSSNKISKNEQLVVYYFYGDKRCITCKNIEEYTKETITMKFADEVRDGRIQWKPVNIDKAENQHFVKDYELFTKAVVISLVKDGKEKNWKNLDRIWVLVKNKNEFTNYIETEVRNFTGDKDG